MGQSQVLQSTKKKDGFRAIPEQSGEVAKLAYQYYAERGFQDGHDQEDWLRAEAELGKQKGR